MTVSPPPAWEYAYSLPDPRSPRADAWAAVDRGEPSDDPLIDLEATRVYGGDREGPLRRIRAEWGFARAEAWRISVSRNDPGAILSDREYFDGATDSWSRFGRARFLAHFSHYAQAVEELDLALREVTDPVLAAIFLVDRARHVRDAESASKAVGALAHALRYARAVGDRTALLLALLAIAEWKVWRVRPRDPRSIARTAASLRRTVALARSCGAERILHLALIAADCLAEKTENRTAIERAVIGNHPLEPTALARSRADNRAKLAREAFRNESILREALDEASQAIFVFQPMHDSRGIRDFLCMVNNRAGDLLAVGPTHVSAEAIRGSGLEGVAELVRKAYATGFAKDLVEGERAHSRVAKSDGARVILTVTDVTEFRGAEAAARQSERIMREFLAHTSHEVRSPLNGILGLARMLDEQPLDLVSGGYVRSILSSGETLLRVLNDVLDLSKLEAGRLEITPVPVDLRSLVGQTADLFRGLAGLNSLAIETSCDPDLPAWVTLDGTRLRQILFNLLGNAVKFSSVGTIRMETRWRPGCVTVEVRDEAGGIPPHEADRIFQPYAQSDRGREAGGTGLGLPLSRRLAEALGGELVYEPIDGGSLFRVTVPTTPAERPVGPTERKGHLGYRVLVAEDEPINGLVVRTMLERLGCRASLVSDGAEAIEAVARHDYDLILMDVRMPEIDGLEATRQLRAVGVTLPICALSAGVMEDERRRCFDSGMDAFLAKPVSEDELARILVELLGPDEGDGNSSAVVPTVPPVPTFASTSLAPPASPATPLPPGHLIPGPWVLDVPEIPPSGPWTAEWERFATDRPTGNPILEVERAIRFRDEEMVRHAFRGVDVRFGQHLADEWRRLLVDGWNGSADGFEVGSALPDGYWKAIARSRYFASGGLYAVAMDEVEAALKYATCPPEVALALVERAHHIRDGESGSVAVSALAQAIRYSRAADDRVSLARALVAAGELRVWRIRRERPRTIARALGALRKAYRATRGLSHPNRRLLAAVELAAEKTNDPLFETKVYGDAGPELAMREFTRLGVAVPPVSARERSDRRIRSAFDRASQAIFVFERQQSRTGAHGYLCVDANAAADRLTDAPNLVGAGEFRHPALSDLSAILDQAWENGDYRDTIEQGGPRSRKIVRDGGELFLTLTDIAPFVEAEQKARESERVTREFLAVTSHEIRSPLNGILGLAQLLDAKGLEGESAAFVRSIVTSGETLRRVLDDVLDHSKLEGGHLELVQEPVSPRAICRETADLFRGLATTKGIEIVVDRDESSPDWITADGARLRQILHNLLGNAIKFSHGGEVRVGARYHSGRFEVSVLDRAGGIAPAELERIFLPYGQSDRGRRAGGTGLGLSLSKRLANAMGGDLGHVPFPGGSIFLLSIPAEACDGPAIETGPTEPLAQRVLVAEDDAINALVLRRQLERLGCSVAVAEDGDTAARMTMERPFDLILMDVRMPGTDGIEATTRLRAAGYRGRIVALSAGVMPEERRECSRAGMDDFLPKPLRPDVLLRVLLESRSAPQKAMPS